ncbi:MAG TPA: hypothetical protein VKB65_11120 [Myxococcota bacterium]|nr:hypothetical protein [Myxococcota bacterium]
MSRGLVIVVAVLALLVGVPLFYLDSLAKDALESGASETFGTTTTLGSVRLGLITGKVGLGNLRVRNPEGWEAKNFFTIGKGRFGVNLSDFLEEEVAVPELVLEDVYLSLERGPGSSNYGTILAHMQKGPPPPPSDEPGKRFVIRDLRIRDVEADLRFDAPGPVDKELKVLIPEIRLRNLGSDTEGGMLVSQLWATVMRGVLAAVVREAGGAGGFITRDLAGDLSRLGNVPFQVIGDATSVGGEIAVEAGKKAGEALGEATGGALGNAGELGEAAGGAVKRGLGGLLDRKD